MHSSKRIIINTFATCGNSIVAIVLSLFSTRWLLEALGQSDFGLYGVVGSIIMLVTFLSGTLSIGVSRFYAYSIGEGQCLSKNESNEKLQQWFNTALSIHIVLPLLLIGIGWPGGEYVLQNYLNVPVERLDACLWVYRISLISTFVAVLSVPFLAMYTAQQRIYELAVFGILRTCAVFVLSWLLLSVNSDRLLVYAFGMMAINACIPLIQIVRCFRIFESCCVRLSCMYNWRYIKQFLGYVGWKIFGTTCYTVRAQGTPILVNMHYGPLVNAAYSIANSLSAQATSLSTAMTQAFQPAIVSEEGRGERKQMLSMSLQACRFGALLVIMFALPLILEMENLLQIWLKNPPVHAADICQWLLAMLIVDRMTTGQMMAVNARGKIALYELIQGTILLSALPLMWLLFRADLEPVSTGIALFATMLSYCIGRIVFAKCLLDFPVLIWIRQVALPVIFISALVCILGSLSVQNIPEGFLRLCLTSAFCSSVALFLAWMILLRKPERAYILNHAIRILRKAPFLSRILPRSGNF